MLARLQFAFYMRGWPTCFVVPPPIPLCFGNKLKGHQTKKTACNVLYEQLREKENQYFCVGLTF